MHDYVCGPVELQSYEIIVRVVLYNHIEVLGLRVDLSTP